MLVAAAVAVTFAGASSLASCSGNKQAADTDSVGGPKLGAAAKGGPAIDKSMDSTLQAMIKEVVPQFKQLEYKDAVTGKTIKYNLFTPANLEAGKKYPLVMFIADASTPGKDVKAPLTQGYGALVWATAESQKDNPCYVLVPQFSGVTVNDAYERTDEVDAAVRLLGDVTANNAVDTSRLYATGQSMGGMMAMYYAVAYPETFAASMFVDSHWDPSTFEKLVKQKFIYFIAGKEGKAYKCLEPIENACRAQGVQYTTAEWSAALPVERQSELAATMLAKGAPVNVFMFEPKSVLPDGVTGSEHMYSFDCAYRIPAVRSWLFRQSK